MSRLHGKHHNHHNNTPVIPPRNPHEEVRVGTEFTGVVDGIFPGGYLCTIRKGNGVTFRSSMFISDQPSLIQGDVNVNVPLVASNVSLTQNTGNSEACIDLNTSKKIPEFEVDDDFSTDYSYLEMSSPSDEIQMPDLLQYFEKFEPVVLQPVNQTNSSNKGKGVSIDLNSAPTPTGHRISNQTNSSNKGKGVPIDLNSAPTPTGHRISNQTNSSNKGMGASIDLNSAPTPTGHRISKDPFLPRNFPSPAGSIRPPDELIAKTSWPSKQGEEKGNSSKGRGVLLHF